MNKTKTESFEDLEKLDKSELIGMLWANQSLVKILDHKLLAFPELKELAVEVAKDYEDAADWKDAIGKLQSMARNALSKTRDKENITNKLDLAALIEKYGSEVKQDFEGFSTSEECELILKEINRNKNIFGEGDSEYIQVLCDIVLIKILGYLNEGDFDGHYYVEKVLDTMMFWDDVLTCRYLLKSGINWNKGE